jgi:hypothetical protein
MQAMERFMNHGSIVAEGMLHGSAEISAANSVSLKG